jgi:hypothetical protein
VFELPTGRLTGRADGRETESSCGKSNRGGLGGGDPSSVSRYESRNARTRRAASSSTHDLLRGDLFSLPVGGPSDLRFASRLSGARFIDPADPAEGGAFSYHS